MELSILKFCIGFPRSIEKPQQSTSSFEFMPRTRGGHKFSEKIFDKGETMRLNDARMKSTYLIKTIAVAFAAAAISTTVQADTEIAPFVGANVATGSIKVSNGEYSTFTVRTWSGGNSTTSTVTGTLAKLNVAGQVTFQSVTNTSATSTISGTVTKGKITNKEVLQAIVGAEEVRGYTLVGIVDSDNSDQEVGLTVSLVGAYNANDNEVSVRFSDGTNTTWAESYSSPDVITQKSYDSDKGVVKSKGFSSAYISVLAPSVPSYVTLQGSGTYQETKTLNKTTGAIEGRSRTNISVPKATGANPNTL